MWVHHRFLRWSPCCSSFYFAVLCYFVLFVIVLCLVCPVLFIIVLCIVCRVLFVIVLCLVCPVLFVIALCLVCRVLSVYLNCPFLIVRSVFLHVNLLCIYFIFNEGMTKSCVLCDQCYMCLWIVHFWLFSHTFVYYIRILGSMKEWRK
jgi:hypothetical protein